MKQLKYLFTALLLLCTTSATAHDFEVGGIKYRIISNENKTVEVCTNNYYVDGLGEVVDPYTQSCISIPEYCTYNGVTYRVTSIGAQAFYCCTRLTSIEIPNSVTSIGSYAFFQCHGLNEVHISDIGAWCCIDFDDDEANPLYYAENLYLNGELVTDVVIPNTVTSIGSYAFCRYDGLTSIVIPNSVTSIGSYAFYCCTGLKTVINFSELTFSKGSSDYGDIAYYADKVINAPNGELVGDYYFAEINGVKTLCCYIGNDTVITLPDNYKGENYAIGNYAFAYCSGLTSVVIPNSVTSIRSYAFSGCTGLTSIVIPNSVTSIGSDAFRGCTGLNTVINFSELTFSKGSIAYGYIAYYADKVINAPNGELVGDYCFAEINGVKTLCCYIGNDTVITLPDNYKGENYAIGNYAFAYCFGLTSVVIPNSVTSIRSYAFRGCTGLTSIVIPNSVTSIGSYAFEYCTGLKTVCNFSNLTFRKASSNNGYVAYYADKVYNAPNGSIEGDFIFGKPNDVNTLVGYLGNATELNLPDNYKGENYAIGSYAFNGYTGLTSIEIPNCVTSIGADAFKGCNGLNEVHISNIGAWCCIDFDSYTSNPLYYAKNLYLNGELVTDFVIPNTVTRIGNYAFSGCTGLTSIVIPDSVTSIGTSAFEGCTDVEYLYISSAIESIGNSAFARCEKIKDIKIGAEKPVRGNSNIFADAVYDNATLYIPIGTESLYQKREPWNLFFYIIEMDLTGIDEVNDELKGENGEVKTIYDLNGRVVENPSNGIYIIDGRKVLVQ